MSSEPLLRRAAEDRKWRDYGPSAQRGPDLRVLVKIGSSLERALIAPRVGDPAIRRHEQQPRDAGAAISIRFDDAGVKTARLQLSRGRHLGVEHPNSFVEVGKGSAAAQI